MQCAVCGAEAEDLTRGDFDGVIVGCKRCGEYEVVDGVLNDFLRLDYDQRVAALEAAKAAAEPGGRPSIGALVP
jgi:hypothetical protein